MLREFCDSLEDAASSAESTDLSNLQAWLGWAREQADEMDPALRPNRVNEIDFEVTPTDEELKPFMEGWSPSAPHKDYA